MKKQISMAWILWVVSMHFLVNYSYSQPFQQSEFIIGTMVEPYMDLPNNNTAEKNYCIRIMQGIKNAHFNLYSGIQYFDYSFTHSGSNIVRKLDLLALTPSLLGLKGLGYHKYLFGNNDNLTSVRPSDIFLTPQTYKDRFDLAFTSGGSIYTADCSSGNCLDKLYGFYLMDEPNVLMKPSILDWSAVINTTYTYQKLPYINFAYQNGQYYGDMSTQSARTNFGNGMNSYINTSVANADAQVVPFEVYPFGELFCTSTPSQIGSGIGKNKFIENYFWMLDTTKKLAQGRPVWAYTLSLEHEKGNDTSVHISNCSAAVNSHYLAPTYNMLMFQDFCPLAYGAKGIIYFTYKRPYGMTTGVTLSNGAASSGAIVSDNADPDTMTCTQRYQDVKNINYFMEKIVGPVVMDYNWIGAFHKSSLPTNEVSLPSDNFLTSSTNTIIEDVNDSAILFGVFKKTEGGCSRYQLLVVNKSLTTTPSAPTITLKGNWVSKMAVSPQVGTPPTINISIPCSTFTSAGSPYNGSTSYTSLTGTYSSGTNTTSFTMPSLQGGEGRLVLLDGCIIFGKKDLDLDPLINIPILAVPNPTSTATRFEYDLTNVPEDYKKITVRIIDTYGRKVAEFDDYSTDKAIHKTDFDINSQMASGIYYALLYVDGVKRGYQILQIIK